jgi:hypothetical protein
LAKERVLSALMGCNSGKGGGFPPSLLPFVRRARGAAYFVGKRYIPLGSAGEKIAQVLQQREVVDLVSWIPLFYPQKNILPLGKNTH